MATYLIDYENTSFHGLEGFKKLAPKDTVVIFLGAKNSSSSMPLDVVRDLTWIGERPLLLWKRSKKSSKNYLDLQLVSYLGSLIGDANIDENEYVIVSNDRDFDAAVDFWEERARDVKISVRNTIAPTATAPPVSGASSQTSARIAGSPDPKLSPAVRPPSAPVSKKPPQTSPQSNKASVAAHPATPPPQKLPPSEAVRRAVRKAVVPLKLKPSDYATIYRIFMVSVSSQELHSQLTKELKGRGQEVYSLVKSIFSQYLNETSSSTTK